MADRSIRASDDDREKVVDSLREHTAQGRLTLDEFEERMSQAYAAKTLGDLGELSRDLPAEDGSGGGPYGRATRPERSEQHVGKKAPQGPAIPRIAYLVPVLIVAAILAGPAIAAGSARAVPVPLLFIGLFWLFCGRGCRPRSTRHH